MRTPLILVTLAAASFAGADSASAQGRNRTPAAAPSKPSGSLTAFRSDSELRAFLRRLKRQEDANPPIPVPVMMETPPPAPPPPSPPPPPGAAVPAPVTTVSGEEFFQTAQSKAADGITNNQEANVDEGGIVKMRGDTLVILRRGRLFTVSLAGGTMRPIHSIDASPPGVSGRGDWYDEMLISGDRVIVVGYSYARGGTEINRFRLDPAGRLRFEDAWHLKSNDYYSSRNYASRLIGNRLIFYTPLQFEWDDEDDDVFEMLPGVRRWQGGEGAEKRRFKRIASARQVFIAPVMRNSRDAVVDTLHSVTSCDLTAADLGCSATAVLGPESRTFYVSAQGVYIWVTDAWNSDRPESYLYRLPFGRERPSATAARGAPVDQFSFREDIAEGILNVLVRSDGGGDAMFASEAGGGGAGVALLRVRFSDFGDASRQVPRTRYRFLPSVPGWSFHNRFAGDYVLYGAGTYGEAARRANLIAARLRDGRVTQLPVPHSVDRIELLGGDAMVIGGAQRGLGFSTVELDGRAPDLGDRYVHPDSAEGESRSHAFFFSPDPDAPGGASGTVGLPVAKRADPALARFFGSSAAMVFLRREQRRLAPAGELEARTRGVVDDDCKASCVDWYGNARPIFWSGRTFALLGYELVEGELARGRIREVGRIDFAPGRTGRQ
ncbi:MAG TPA: beta-propeller domain-containing protein [Allosphingosinicella sp.]|nr:beta-propeller domain-containing protein [Allosphingosinicella sp.]